MLKQFLVKASATVAYLSLLSLSAAHAELPNGIEAGDEKLTLNGSGARTKQPVVGVMDRRRRQLDTGDGCEDRLEGRRLDADGVRKTEQRQGDTARESFVDRHPSELDVKHAIGVILQVIANNESWATRAAAVAVDPLAGAISVADEFEVP
jgi:hypothetical protein